jgi:hypothetical protein
VFFIIASSYKGFPFLLFLFHEESGILSQAASNGSADPFHKIGSNDAVGGRYTPTSLLSVS